MKLARAGAFGIAIPGFECLVVCANSDGNTAESHLGIGSGPELPIQN
jgi:hypothetical protein